MAERIILKARVAGIDFADVIRSEAELAAAEWKAQPVTLRDDEVSIVESDPTESDTYSHENDAPEDYDISGSGMTAVGSFIKASAAQLVELMGGKAAGEGEAAAYYHPGSKLILEKAIRFRLKGGGSIILPQVKGAVQFNSNMGFDGVMKFPFRFRALTQTGFNYDMIIQ